MDKEELKRRENLLNNMLRKKQETKDKIKTLKNEYKNLEKQKNIIIEKQMKLAFKINELEKTLQ